MYMYILYNYMYTCVMLHTSTNLPLLLFKQNLGNLVCRKEVLLYLYIHCAYRREESTD